MRAGLDKDENGPTPHIVHVFPDRPTETAPAYVRLFFLNET
jgi:hypothetical protein